LHLWWSLLADFSQNSGKLSKSYKAVLKSAIRGQFLHHRKEKNRKFSSSRDRSFQILFKDRKQRRRFDNRYMIKTIAFFNNENR